MDEELTAFLSKLQKLQREISKVEGSQVQSGDARKALHDISLEYARGLRPKFGSLAASQEANQVGEIFSELLLASRKRPSKERCIGLIRDARKILANLETKVLLETSSSEGGIQTPVDTLILESLKDISTSAGLCYEQALKDLQIRNRLSYRGTATDLREALRETLDVLAPDKEVEALSGYKAEPDAKRPTMKQKVRFILRNRGMKSGQLEPPETAVAGIEEIVGGMVRSVYTRSSVSTHTPTDIDEVLRVHGWVRMVMCDLLEIPL